MTRVAKSKRAWVGSNHSIVTKPDWFLGGYLVVDSEENTTLFNSTFPRVVWVILVVALPEESLDLFSAKISDKTMVLVAAWSLKQKKPRFNIEHNV